MFLYKLANHFLTVAFTASCTFAHLLLVFTFGCIGYIIAVRVVINSESKIGSIIEFFLMVAYTYSTDSIGYFISIIT